MKRLSQIFKTFLLAFSPALVLLFGSASLAQAATAPRMYLQTPTTASANSTLKVAVRIDPNDTAVDTVNVQLAFPSDKLTFQSVDKAGSAFSAFIPSDPSANNGSLQFAASHLAGSNSAITEDSLVATLLFTVKASNGSANLSLDGSSAATNGTEVAVTNNDSAVSLTAASGSASQLEATGIKVTDVVVNGATVRWHTAVPSNSSVDYGSTNHYGNSISSEVLVTDHVLALNPIFGGGTTVHFRVNSVDADGNAASSKDQTFVTRGYTVALYIKDKAGKAVANKKVSVGTNTATTDNSGAVKLTNVLPGNQEVKITSSEPQFITVKAIRGVSATDVQSFNVTTKPRSVIPWLVLALSVLVCVALIVLLWRERGKRQASTQL